MSKITQALEKAARERLQRRQEQATVPSTTVTVPLVASRLGDIAAAGEVHIDPHIVSATDPTSPIAEQYRILGTNLQSLRLPAAARAAQAGPRSGPKVFVVTSAVHGEGKSVTALNLALTLARQEQLRVLLVDGDLRKGTIHRWLGLSETHGGFSGALLHNGELNGSLLKLHTPPLTLLPAGEVPEQPAELLGSAALRRFLSIVRSQFDVILIDTPPVLPVADPGILASQTDGVLFVVRAGRTQRKTVEVAQTRLRQMKANVLGCVLTHVEHHLPGYDRDYRYYRAAKQEAQDANGRASGGEVSGEPADAATGSRN